MRNYLPILLLLWMLSIAAPYTGWTQSGTGNQWVLQTQQQDYWKFPVVHTGIYRIDSAALAQAGVLTAPGFDPRRLQLFRNGTEVPLYIHGEQDGVFNAVDFVEFFGTGNDASPDLVFFEDTSYAVNKSFSLFTDTAYYFLTIATSFSNARLVAETDVAYSNFLPAENYFLTKSWYEPAGTYSEGGFLGNDYSRDSRYMDGEGWVDFPFGIDGNLTNPRPVNLQTGGAYTQGPAAVLNYTLVGRSRYNYNFPAQQGKNHHVRVSISNAPGHLDDFTYFGYQTIRRSVQVPATSLSTGFSTTFLFGAIDDMSTNPAQDPTRSDRNSIARAELTFPHGTNLNNATEKWMYIPDHQQKNKTYLSLTNLSISSGNPILYDLTNSKRIVVTHTGNIQQMLIPNSAPGKPSLKECYLTSEAMIRTVAQLKPLSTGTRFPDFLSQFSQTPYDYLIITHPSLRNAADDYAHYRKFNGYPTLYEPVIVDIEALYEQFSFGIRNNPLAVEHFLRYLFQNQVLPENIFILGKGYSTNHTRRDSAIFRKSLVPGWGFPATDNIYLQKLQPGHVQDHHIGRLAASSSTDVHLYLNKVRQHEDSLRLHNALWMKRAIHLGGGNNASEQSIIKTSLAKWENVLEAPSFGGHVTTFLKNTTQPIEIIQSQHLKNLINSGVRIMSFYGHGSSSGFDISTDAVSNYQNEGRYPLVIANSCYSGDLFNKVTTKSEEFVLTPQKGAIAYLGSSNYSTIDALNLKGDTLYHYIANAGYGNTLGSLVRSGLRPLADFPSFYHIASYQQTTLHGDPAIVLNVQDLPDYRITPPQIFFSPSVISNEIDSFNIHIISQNPGRAVTDSFTVNIRRTFPNQSFTDTLLRYPSTAFIDTFLITLPVAKTKGVGMNTFQVNLDAMQEIQESDETNNSALVTLYIKASSLIPVYPPEFAVVPNSPITLYASTIDPFSKEKTYHFQLANNPNFTPPLATYTTKGKGGVLSWEPPVVLTDSMVYFWRVCVDSLDHPEGITDWRKSSFRYITGRSGWAQAHMHQHTANQYQYVEPDTITDSFSFITALREITAQTGIHPNLPGNQHFYAVNGTFKYQHSEIIKQSMAGGFIFAIFDTIGAEPMQAMNSSTSWTGNWGNFQEPGTTKNAFEFPLHTPMLRDRLTAFFDSIPNGYYVLGYSVKDHHASLMSEPLLQGFESIGSSMIRTLPANSSYIIFGKKGVSIGDPNHVQEVLRTSATDTATLTKQIQVDWYAGSITSSLIGPATKWGAAYWKQHPDASDPFNADSLSFSLLAIDHQGNTHQIPALTNLAPHPDSVILLHNHVDASLYPYLRFKVDMEDPVHRTPPQLKSWMVFYTPAPETALDPAAWFTFYNDTVQQGDSIRFSLATRNLSLQTMDSLLVHCWIIDSQRQMHASQYKRFREHPAGDTLIVEGFSFPTHQLAAGPATLWVEVNPVRPATGSYDQPEQTHLNNIAELPFYIKPDRQSPLLDVTFDGIRILDGDIVSAQPVIEIQLNDDNPFFVFDQPEDTALFRIYLRAPGETEFSQLFFMSDGKEVMYFYPASGKHNSCRIVFPADFLDNDGNYLLRVEATDKSMGSSGAARYQISFKVISKASITEVLNWPNPFTTKTHFVFTLTGYEVPTDFRIQIMNISGTVIRELTMTELGPINLGRNITSGFWDGTDEFGDRVANGVYLYRVHTNLRGRRIEKSASGADPFFREGWGKMYLMR